MGEALKTLARVESTRIPIRIERESSTNVNCISGQIVITSGPYLAIKPIGGNCWRTTFLEGDILSVKNFSHEIFLLGLSNGNLIAIEWESLHLKWRLHLKDGTPIRQIECNEEFLCLLGGEEEASILVTFYKESISMAINTEANQEELRDSACYYELSHGRVLKFIITENGTTNGKPLGWMDGWPEQTTSRKECARVILIGSKPMFSLYELPPVSEAFPDPIGLATEYLSNAVSNWWGRNPKSEERGLLLRKLPIGHLRPLLSLDDTDRTISQVLPTTNGNDYILFDAYHGRALLFDPVSGLICKQIKGLRSCKISLSPKLSPIINEQQQSNHQSNRPMKSSETLIAIYPKRNYFDMINLETGDITHRVEFPKLETNPGDQWHFPIGYDSVIDSTLFVVIWPEMEGFQLTLYKLN